MVDNPNERGAKLKKIPSLFLGSLLMAVILSGCSSSDEKLTLDSKHKDLPDFVLNSSEKVQETYVMAAQFPQVLASVPCYCGCGGEHGHKSNLDCFVDQIGANNSVTEWDQMGIS